MKKPKNPDQWTLGFLTDLWMRGFISDRTLAALDKLGKKLDDGDDSDLPSQAYYRLAAERFIEHKAKIFFVPETLAIHFGGWVLTERGKQAVDKWRPHIVRVNGKPSQGLIFYTQSSREAAEMLLELLVSKPPFLSLPTEYAELSSLLSDGGMMTVESRNKKAVFFLEGSSLIEAETE